MTEILWTAENQHLKVTIFTNASAEFLVKANQATWQMGAIAIQEDNPIDVGHAWLRTQRSVCEEYPATFLGVREGDVLRFTLIGRENRAQGSLTVKPRLDECWFELEIPEIDPRLPSLVFPPPIVSESLIIPSGVGRWIRQPLPGRFVWVYPTWLNMRWFGGLCGQQGWLAILDEGFENAGVFAAELLAAPVWLQSLREWKYPRRIRYGFTDGGYVGLAKTFRTYAIQQGLHLSLQEKMHTSPALRNALGGRMLSFMQARGYHPEHYPARWQPTPPPPPNLQGNLLLSFTHRQVEDVINDALACGMTNGIINLRGWINGGYDESHPDILPIEPALGSQAEFERLTRRGDPLLVVLHDNYQDIYEHCPSFPHGVVIRQDGSLMPGGFWAGGQAYILNSSASIAYARRNWETLGKLGVRGYFVDTTACAQFYENHEPGNCLSRRQERELKTELLRFYRVQGLVVGSEEGSDFVTSVVDWIETRHRRVPGESIPLWQLVFHDACFCLRYNSGSAKNESPTSPVPNYLADILWGCMVNWYTHSPAEWPQEKDDFQTTLQVDRWHARIGADEMTDHCYLCEDGLVERTEFTSAAVIVNFAAEPRQVKGITVPPRGYVIQQ